MSSSRLCVRVRLCEIRLFGLVLLLFCFCLSRKSFVCFFLWSYMCFVSVCRKVRLFCMSVVLLLVYFCLSRISFFSVVLLVFGFWFVGKVFFVISLVFGLLYMQSVRVLFCLHLFLTGSSFPRVVYSLFCASV